MATNAVTLAIIIVQFILLRKKKKTEQEEEPQGYSNFLAVSRDAAFEYIEDVQSTIKQLRSAYNRGDKDDVQIAYNKLIKHLPADEV